MTPAFVTIISAGASMLTAILVVLLNRFFGRKKERAEAADVQADSDQKYSDLADKMRERYDTLIDKNTDLWRELDQVKSALRVLINGIEDHPNDEVRLRADAAAARSVL